MWFNRTGQNLCDVDLITKHLKGKKNQKKFENHPLGQLHRLQKYGNELLLKKNKFDTSTLPKSLPHTNSISSIQMDQILSMI